MVSTIPTSERKVMNKKEIKDIYNGKWIFLTNIQDNPYSTVPVVIADAPYEGSEDGIYQDFIGNDDYGTTGYTSLLLCASITGFEVC